MNKEVVHLRHQDNRRVWRDNTNKDNRDWYAKHCKRLTECWINANNKPSVKITDDRAKVTCKRCLGSKS
jgi:hypothetical protein